MRCVGLQCDEVRVIGERGDEVQGVGVQLDASSLKPWHSWWRCRLQGDGEQAREVVGI